MRAYRAHKHQVQIGQDRRVVVELLAEIPVGSVVEVLVLVPEGPTVPPEL